MATWARFVNIDVALIFQGGWGYSSPTREEYQRGDIAEGWICWGKYHISMQHFLCFRLTSNQMVHLFLNVITCTIWMNILFEIWQLFIWIWKKRSIKQIIYFILCIIFLLFFNKITHDHHVISFVIRTICLIIFMIFTWHRFEMATITSFCFRK